MTILASIVVVTNIGFTVGFDTCSRCPSWVSYDLEPHEVVKAERKSFRFVPDPRIDLPDVNGMQIFYDGLGRSGWDRGHLAPAADFNWDTNALRQTYYFSNVCPMASNVNRGEWLKAENEVRHLAASGTVHVVTFPVFRSGWRCAVGPKGRPDFPDAFVKVAWGYFGVRFWQVENERK